MGRLWILGLAMLLAWLVAGCSAAGAVRGAIGELPDSTATYWRRVAVEQLQRAIEGGRVRDSLRAQVRGLEAKVEELEHGLSLMTAEAVRRGAALDTLRQRGCTPIGWRGTAHEPLASGSGVTLESFQNRSRAFTKSSALM